MPIPHFWEPRELLGTDPSESGFTCTAIVMPMKQGQLREEPRRCSLTMLSNESKSQACRALDILAQIDVVSKGVSEGIGRALVRVAELTSCPRWHRKPRYSQAEAVAAKWKDVVQLFVANERALIRGAGRERMGIVPASISGSAPRHEQELLVPRGWRPSVPDLEVHEQRSVVERTPRRLRENQPQPLAAAAERRPRQQQQTPPQLQAAPQTEAYNLRPYQPRPVQEPALEMAQAYVNHDVHRANLAARAAERSLAQQQQAEVPLDPNRDQPAIRDWPSRPYQAPQPEARLERAVESRQRPPRPQILQPAEEYRPRPAAAEPCIDVAEGREAIQRAQEQISRIELDFLEHMEARFGHLEAEGFRRFLAIQAPAVHTVPICNTGREPEVVRGEEAVISPAAGEPRVRPAVAVAVPAPARPYVPVRKLLEECFICNDGFDSPDNAIWCQGQCGTNVHRECFEEWNRINEDAGRRCGFCRRLWVEQP